jgi:hypothetical protein
MGFLTKKQRPVPRRRLVDTDEARTNRADASSSENRYTFRRNRTLTGSLSSEVASVNEHRAELKSTRVHAHHLRRHRKHAGLALLAVAAAAAGLAFLIYQSISTVALSSAVAKPIDTQLYTSKIIDYLNKHPGERFRFSLNTDSLTTYLQTHDAPEVLSVSGDTSYVGFGKTSLYLHFREPVVVWQTGGQRLYVDSNGVAFTRNYFGEPAVQVVDQTGIQATNNQVLVSNRFLGFIGLVVGRMGTYGHKVTDIILPAGTTRQVEVKCAGLAYPIKFSIDRSVGEQAEDANRAITYLAGHGIGVEYLDVRVSNRAFYK